MFVLNHPPNESSDEQRRELALIFEYRDESLLHFPAFLDLCLGALGCGVSGRRRWDSRKEEGIPMRIGCLLACLGAIGRLEGVQGDGDRL